MQLWILHQGKDFPLQISQSVQVGHVDLPTAQQKAT